MRIIITMFDSMFQKCMTQFKSNHQNVLFLTDLGSVIIDMCHEKTDLKRSLSVSYPKKD